MTFSIFYVVNGNIDVLRDTNGNMSIFQDFNLAFNTAKQLARNNSNVIISIVENESGSIIVDFQ